VEKGQVTGLVIILAMLSIAISTATSSTDKNHSANGELDISTLIPYGDIIKNNSWFIPIVICIFGGLALIFAALSFFIGPGIFREKMRFLRSKTIDGDRIASRGNYYRHEMIKQVRNIWIKGFLENSLYNVTTIELCLDECKDKIDLRGIIVVQPPNGIPRQLPPSSRLIEVFDELGGSFLILGEPGSGKTILLLQLAEKLLDRAEGDINHPIPAVFNLSAWAALRPPLADWLIDELFLRYGVSQSLGEKWINEDNILPLLDGLDEVAREHREACIAEIKKFREQHGLLPLIVCSRKEEYEALDIKLNLATAIVIKPLTRSQVEQYLNSIGKPIMGVLIVLQEDQILWDLLKTPFMLNIVTLAFKGKPAESVRGIEDMNKRRSQVFAAYKQAMFKRPGRSINTNYTPHQTEHWLSWLARSMKERNLSVFYLEQIELDWLPFPWHRTILKVMLIGIGGLVGGLAIGLAHGPSFGLGVGLGIGLGAGQIYGLGFGLEDGLQRAERLLYNYFGLARGLAFGLTIGVIVGLISGLTAGLTIGIIIGLAIGLSRGLAFGLEMKELETGRSPNERVQRSAKNALLVGPILGMTITIGIGLIYGMGFGPDVELIEGPILGLAVALGVWLIYGGSPWVLHYLLIIAFRINNFAPLKYAHFLDYATDRIFLRKVGGGYVFIHRMIMDYFASLEPDEVINNEKSTSKSMLGSVFFFSVK
jgi:hypothetical protein